MTGDAARDCPVCDLPAVEEAGRCGTCGARLLGGYVIGPPPPQAQRDLDRLIASERRRYALRAAARAAGWLGPDWLAALAGLATGEATVTDDELEGTARDAAEAAAATADGIVFSLSRLVGDETDAIVFVEISPDGLAVFALVADELRVPVLRPGDRVAWTDALPGLPAHDDALRMYLLAGGLAAREPAGPASGGTPATDGPLAGPGLIDAATAAAGREAARLARAMASGLLADAGPRRPRLIGPDIVLVRRTQGWPALESAASRVGDVLRPVAEIVAPGTAPLQAVVAEMARRAPLRYDYCLMLADVDQPTGRVHRDPCLLFPAGTTVRPHVVQVRDVLVTAPPAPARRLALPVVARRGDDPASWPVVSARAMDGTFPGVTQLRIQLDGPGQVSMSASPRPLPEDTALRWPGLLDELPGQVAAAVVADVVLLAELGGDEKTVARRVSLLDDLLGELDRTGIRAGVIGYREHWDHYPAPGLLVRIEPGEAADIRTRLTRDDLWRAVEVRDRHAAPLEDALDAVARPDWKWRSGARHLLVVLGARPPHPSRIDARGEVPATPCPWKHDWDAILVQLRRQLDVKCIAVIPEGAPEEPWLEFSGGFGLFYAERSPCDGIVRALGIGKEDPGARVPLAVRAPDARRAGGPGSR